MVLLMQMNTKNWQDGMMFEVFLPLKYLVLTRTNLRTTKEHVQLMPLSMLVLVLQKPKLRQLWVVEEVAVDLLV